MQNFVFCTIWTYWAIFGFHTSPISDECKTPVSKFFGPAMRTGSSRQFQWYCTIDMFVSSQIPLTVVYGFYCKKGKLTWNTHRGCGYCWNCLDKPMITAVPKTMLTQFCIHHGLDSWVPYVLYLLFTTREAAWSSDAFFKLESISFS